MSSAKLTILETTANNFGLSDIPLKYDLSIFNSVSGCSLRAPKEVKPDPKSSTAKPIPESFSNLKLFSPSLDSRTEALSVISAVTISKGISYERTRSISSLAKDLSGNLSNPYANLSVSTAGAAMQVEEADIALANTLDTLRATGASAGGATALAQAALQSKKGVAASIEAQEASNEKLRAQGEQTLQQLELGEQRRIQGVQIQEGVRVQQGEALGRQFAFQAQEQRESGKINYTRNQITGAQQRQTNAYNQGTKAMMGAIGGLTQIGAVGAAGGFSKNPTDDQKEALTALI